MQKLIHCVIFQTFMCDRQDDGSAYLRVDYSVQCWESDAAGRSWAAAYVPMMIYAVIMVFFYPIGTPLLYASVLYANREAIEKLERLEAGLVLNWAEVVSYISEVRLGSILDMHLMPRERQQWGDGKGARYAADWKKPEEPPRSAATRGAYLTRSRLKVDDFGDFTVGWRARAPLAEIRAKSGRFWITVG